MFKFENLDEITRSFMLEAIMEGEKTKSLYISQRFNDLGKHPEMWVALLKEAVRKYDEVWLTKQLKDLKMMKKQEQTRRGVRRINGESMLAEGQFNLFYMLGLCKRAKSEDISQLQIYRARESKASRVTSNKLDGTYMSVIDIETELKDTKPSSRKLGKVDSGLSIRLPR